MRDVRQVRVFVLPVLPDPAESEADAVLLSGRRLQPARGLQAAQAAAENPLRNRRQELAADFREVQGAQQRYRVQNVPKDTRRLRKITGTRRARSVLLKGKRQPSPAEQP